MTTALITVSQAAQQIGMAPRTVRKLCDEHGLGIAVNQRLRLLTAAEVKRLGKLKRPVGNPDFGPGFRPKKKS